MEIKENIYYVGVKDKELKSFDLMMDINHGTTYNAYLLKGENAIALIDSVKAEFADEYIENIKQYVNIKKIDYLIVNHTEPDHSGAIEKLLKLNPNIIVCGTKMAIDFVRNIINFDFNSKVLTANDSLDLGGKELKFFAFPMLHWPDSMFTYLKEDKILFSCDSFGVHFASDKMYSDEVKDKEALDVEFKNYFDEILGPYKKPFMQNALKKLELIEIDMICPGHGPMIRKDVNSYIETYKKWCDEEQNKKAKITVCYISSYGYTKAIAEALVCGMKKCDVEVNVYDLAVDSIEEAKKSALNSRAIVVGSPTILSNALPQVYEVITSLNPIVNKGMMAMSFGSYAWSGEAADDIMSVMRTLRFRIPYEPIKIKLKPSEYDIETITKKGEDFANLVINE